MKTMKIILLSIICFSFLYAEEEKKPADMDALLAPSDRLEYGGYRILRICEFKEGVVCKYVVSKNGINLASFPAIQKNPPFHFTVGPVLLMCWP